MLYDHPSDMEPLMPAEEDGLSALAVALVRSAERLRPSFHPIVLTSLIDLVRSMSSYYSNLIEGHRPTPRDIDAAIRREFSMDDGRRSLQMQHIAHMEVQAAMEERLETLSPGDICFAQFLCWLHEELYRRMPTEFRWTEGGHGNKYEIQPGELRRGEVSVGRHLAPASQKLGEFLKRFQEFYGPLVNKEPRSLIAAAAAHHRLAWIHPFPDGNGRVIRLFTQAWLVKAGVSGQGLWTISHGLAKQTSGYRVSLDNADQRRMNDFDGRGYLSQRYLGAFCHFVLTTAMNELQFMEELLAPIGVLNRIVGYAGQRESEKKLAEGSSAVLREIVLHGEIARDQIAAITGVPPQAANEIIGDLIAQGLVTSSSPNGSLRLGIPGDAASHYFPNFYPVDSD